MFCTQCGTANDDDAKFCKQCGRPFTATAPAPTAGVTAAEQPVWEGSPSQIINLPKFIGAAVIVLSALALAAAVHPAFLALLLVPLPYAAYHWLLVRSHRYKLSTQRLTVSQGVLAKNVSNLELYRVEDVTLVQPLLLRLLALGNVALITADASTPRLVLRAVPLELRELLRKNVEECRARRRVTEMRLQP